MLLKRPKGNEEDTKFIRREAASIIIEIDSQNNFLWGIFSEYQFRINRKGNIHNYHGIERIRIE